MPTLNSPTMPSASEPPPSPASAPAKTVDASRIRRLGTPRDRATPSAGPVARRRSPARVLASDHAITGTAIHAAYVSGSLPERMSPTIGMPSSPGISMRGNRLMPSGS